MRNAILGMTFLSLGAVYFWTKSQKEPPGLEVPIFDFEKQDLQEVVIYQPKQEVRLVNKDGRWTLMQANNEASTTMVNRSKHQLHNLKARSIVEREPADLSVYGLGENGIKVDLAVRGEEPSSLMIGQANPTGVSYYVLPLSGPHEGTVVTVAKAAVDFFASELSAFRAEHFVQFDLSAVDSVEIVLSTELVTQKNLGDTARTWKAKRTSVTDFQYWTGGFTDEVENRISNDFMRRLLGRYLALKSKGYKGVSEMSEDAAGLNPPLVSIQLSGNGVDTTLRIGNQVSDGLRHFTVNDLTDIVLARDGLLEDYSFDMAQTRNRKPFDFMNNINGLQSISMSLSQSTPEISEMEKKIFKRAGEEWSFGERSIEAENATAFLNQLSKCTTLETLEDTIAADGFTKSEDTAVSHIEIEHNLQTVVLEIGAMVERNMAMSDTEPPQVVQYRQVRFSLEDSSSQTTFVEEHWVQGMLTALAQLEQTLPPEMK